MIMRRLIPLLVLLLALASCKTRVVPVDVHHYHRDSVATIQRDTILQVDSVIIKQIGDTIYIRETSDRVRATSETKSKSQADSVPILHQLTPPSPPETPPIPPSRSNILLLLAIGASIPIALYITYRITKNQYKKH